MAKMGRPKVDHPKLKSVGIRLSDENYQKLMEYNESHNMTITETMQKAFELLLASEEKVKA